MKKSFIGVAAIFFALMTPAKADGPSIDASLSGFGDRHAIYVKAKSFEGIDRKSTRLNSSH